MRRPASFPHRRLFRLARAAMVVQALVVAGLLLADRIFPFPNEVFAHLDVSPQVVAADGTPMHTGLNRQEERLLPCDLETLSPHVVHALLAAEDRRYLSHDGVDGRAVIRAALANVRAGATREGASTVTMQLARLVGDQPRSYPGKAIQAFRAWQLERRYDKAFLLERYLDLVPFSGNLRGIEAAAHAFFGKPASALAPSEAALLVSVLPAPTRYAPWRDPEGALARRNRVLTRMHAEGWLDEATAREAMAGPLGVRRSAFPDLAPHAWLRAGEGRTSIDAVAQQAIERLARETRGVDGLAIVVVNNETRAVHALAGAREADARLLDASIRPRSAGSTLKPVLYALAFDRGIATADTMLLDLPWTSPEWAPTNFDTAWRGPLPAGEALATSRNLPAIRLAAALPRGAFAEALRRAGFRHVRAPEDGPAVDLALGTDDITPMELAGAYAALATDGTWRRPWLLERESGSTASVRVCSRGAAALVTRALSERTRARPLGAPAEGIAWKTGTSSGRRDAWAAGYTTRFTAVVWRGRLDGRTHTSLVGAQTAEPLLFAVLQAVDPSPSAFPALEDTEEVTVCRETGLAATTSCAESRRVLRPKDALPLRRCDVHHALVFDRVTGQLRCPHCARGHDVVEKSVAVHPPVLTTWRRTVGLPLESLPRHAPDCLDPIEPEALRPQFQSPRPGQVFRAIAGQASVVVRVLHHRAEERIDLLLDGRVVGRALPSTSLPLTLAPGRHTLTALAADGRYATIRVVVRDR